MDDVSLITNNFKIGALDHVSFYFDGMKSKNDSGGMVLNKGKGYEKISYF